MSRLLAIAPRVRRLRRRAPARNGAGVRACVVKL